MSEEITIKFKEQTGFRILERDISTGKVIVNDIEITSVEDWEKVTKSLVELQQENQQLKDELETSKQYEDYYKDLCDKALKTGGKYIGVIKEIREYIVNDIQHCTYGQVPKYQDLLQILDKVKK